MEGTSEEDTQNNSHRRGRTFNKKEVLDLLNLIDKYKHYILNKSNTTSANKAKDAAWAIVVRKFNSLGYDRNHETLKIKFENLKRQPNKTASHIEVLEPIEREIYNKVAALVNTAEKNCIIEVPEDSADDMDEENTQRNEDSDTDDTNDKSARHQRSRAFSTEETLDLLNLIEKYKHYILNKACNASANKAKDAAWAIIVRKYNSLGRSTYRNYESLKTKFENLKRAAYKNGSNLEVLEADESEINIRVTALLCSAEKNCDIELPEDSADEMDEAELSNENTQKNEDSDPDNNDNNDKSVRIRSQNFAPEESRLLLKCVKQEKPFVFCKDITTKAIEMKNQAWSRITNSYNRLSPNKRSTKSLRMKFDSMKKMARKLSNKDMLKNINKKQGKREKLNNSFESIKKEPVLEERMSEDSDQFSEDEPEVEYKKPDVGAFELAPDPDPDPLSSVLNADSGIGSSSTGFWNWNQSENRDVVKLKTELLNYQMETAKLERKRLEEAALEEARERESRAIERALRVRAARLEAVSAAAKFPPSHPALAFRPEEIRAQYYLGQYQ